VNAVGADENIAVRAAAIFKMGNYRVIAALYAGESLAIGDCDVLAPALLRHDRVQVGPHAADVRLAKFGSAGLISGKPVPPFVIDPVLSRGARAPLERAGEPKHCQHVHAVRRQAEAAADLSARLVGFVHCRRNARLLEKQRERRPGHAAANDKHVELVRHEEIPYYLI
jgi:hypothetical protein